MLQISRHKIVLCNIHDVGMPSKSNEFLVARPSLLGNPYTHIQLKSTLAKYVVDSRSKAIAMYGKWLDEMLSSDNEVSREFDKIYEQFKLSNVHLYCYCTPKPCHAEIIANRLVKRMNRELLGLL